ncbi:MAG: DNA primase noncatalytic subunit PriX [Candidatus Bathyarchaeia archaeon]
MKSWYLREDFLKEIQPWLWGRELWFGKGAPRPLKANGPEDFRSLVEKYGKTSVFPLFISTQVFSEPLKLESESPDKLRVNWDFFLDLDCEKFEDVKRAAVKAQKTLERFNVKDFLLKFSGRRGFHLIIPGLSLDIFTAGEYRLAYPKLALNLARFFEAVINEPRVKVDTQVYQPRQMMRAPYSIHEETGLVSVPVNSPLEFKLEMAKVENVKITPFPINGAWGEARELLFSLRDWLKEHGQTEPGLKILSWGEAKRKRDRGYSWIEKLLANPVDDGRHRLLWLIVAPYLVNVKGVPLSEAEKTAYEWLVECNKTKPVEDDLNRLAKYYVEYAARAGLKPLSLETIKTKPEYRELWEIVSAVLPKHGFSIKLLKVESLTQAEPEYEVEKSLIAEIKAVYNEVKKTFHQYPESKHWKKKERRNMIRGWLGEKVFDMTLNQFKIPHVWHHPLIQNEMVGKKERLGPDFTVYGETVDVKVSSQETKPDFYYVNFERWQKAKADILVFMRFSPDLKQAWLSGWLPGSLLESFPVKNLPFALAYEVNGYQLFPFNQLLKKWGGNFGFK